MASERKLHKATIPAGFFRNRKKTGFAVALATLMGIMWVRVLIGHKPPAAAAGEAAPASAPAAAANKPPVKVKYLTLPVTPGRNDTIQCDFFSGRDWSGFPKSSGATSGDTEVVRSGADRTSENVERVAKRLNLQAVILKGDRPEAFINDVSMHVGDRIPLQEGTDLYLFDVKEIRGDAVLVECREKSLTLTIK